MIKSENHKHVALGIFVSLIAIFLFCIIDVLVKKLTDTYSTLQILFFRSFFSLLPLLIVMTLRKNFNQIKTRKVGQHFGIGFLTLFSLGLYFYGLHLLPIADATIIFFTMPIFAVILSSFMLSEKIGVHRWSAVLLGFLGTIVIMQPSGDNASLLGYIVVTISSFTGALSAIYVKRMFKTENTMAIAFWAGVTWSFFTIIGTAYLWVQPTLIDLFALISIGVIGGIGQYAVIKGLELASPSIVTPLNYTRLIWASIFSYLIWSYIPSWHVLFGSLLIIASGLYIFHREVIKGKVE